MNSISPATAAKGGHLPAVLLALFAGLLVALIAVGLTLRRVETVQYIVPDNYRGYFFILIDQRGESLTRDSGVVRLRIPSGGILRVTDDWYLHRWHKDAAQSYSGVPLGSDTDQRHGPKDIVIWELGSASTSDLGQYDAYFVGTPGEREGIRMTDTHAALKARLP